MSADGSSWEYVIEGPAVEAEAEREKWLDRVKITGNKVTVEFEDGGKPKSVTLSITPKPMAITVAMKASSR